MGCGKSVAVAREGDQGHAAAGARALQANKSTANVAVGALVDSTGVQDTGHCNPREAADMFNKAKFGRCSYEACRVPKVLLPDLGAKRAKRQVADQRQERGLSKASKLQRSPSCAFKRGMVRVLATRAGETGGFCSTINEGSCPYVQTRVAPEDIVDHVEVPAAERPSAPAESWLDTACSAPADPCVDSGARSAQRARLALLQISALHGIYRCLLSPAEKARLKLKLAALISRQQEVFQEAASAVPSIARTEAMVPATRDRMECVAGSSSEDEDSTEVPPQRRLGACLPRTGSYHRLDRHERQTDAKSGYVQRLKNEKVETSSDRARVILKPAPSPITALASHRISEYWHASNRGGHASNRGDSRDLQDCVTLLHVQHAMQLQRCP